LLEPNMKHKDLFFLSFFVVVRRTHYSRGVPQMLVMTPFAGVLGVCPANLSPGA
jgi:hypothetical protein